MDLFETNIFLIIMVILNIVLLLCVIISNIRINNIYKRNKEFMRKLGEGKDISEILERYMDRVTDLEKGLSETNVYCKKIDKQMEGCLQKVGIVRYSAYKNCGNDLSFATALLDNKNNGVVLNGIYSREMSNIYAKPIIDGKSSYNLTDEEKDAVARAIKFE